MSCQKKLHEETMREKKGASAKLLKYTGMGWKLDRVGLALVK